MLGCHAMRVAIFSARPFDREFLAAENDRRGGRAHQLDFFDTRLMPATALLARGAQCVCAFVNDRVDAEVLGLLSAGGTRLIALRSAGFNHVDLDAAARLGLTVCRVPAYSPYAVAEHAVALMLTLNRKTHKAYARVREGNFELDGLLGFDLHGATAGIIGTGKIGTCVARALKGFGCRGTGVRFVAARRGAGHRRGIRRAWISCLPTHASSRSTCRSRPKPAT